MNRRVAGMLVVVSFAATGCIVPPDARPQVGLGSTFATRFVHRGMTQVDGPVLQPRLAVTLPTVDEGRMSFVARGNVDLTNDTGDAWFPDGHAGRFTEVDFVASYERQLDETFNVRAGVFNYNLPNGLEFPNGERGGTSEVFVVLSANVLEATPYVSWHYDFDEVRAPYYRAGITEDFDLGKGFKVVLDGSIGYATSAQSSWLYALDRSALADLRGSAELQWMYDDRTQLVAGLHGSAIMDSELDRWFNDVGVFDDDPIWFTLGVNWAF